VRILLVDDDATLRQTLSIGLRAAGHEVLLAADGRTALQAAREDQPDLVVLDLGLPDMDGLEVCRQIRQSLPQLPVLMLTARADEVDTVVGLDAGADDYVTKPFRLAELLARVRALMRRGVTEQPAIGDVRIDVGSRRAWVRGDELQLTTKEFDLLRVLMRDVGNVVTRETIMREVWDASWWGSTKTLDMHISWLRRKLGDDATQPRYITTVRGVGFRFERG
jgi:DNA-binding response OmpR family regulator